MPVAQSNHVQEYDYNADSQLLTVAFVNGAVYQYSGVTQSDYDTFHQSGSKGAYLHSKIIPKYGKGKMLVGGMSTRRGRR